MEQLIEITQELKLSKEIFFEERRKHLSKKKMSAKSIYDTERAWAGLHRFSLEGFGENLLFWGGFVVLLILGQSDMGVESVFLPIIMWIVLLIKIIIRREKMWKERYLFLEKIESERLELEYTDYEVGRDFSPDNVEPTQAVLQKRKNIFLQSGLLLKKR